MRISSIYLSNAKTWHRYLQCKNPSVLPPDTGLCTMEIMRPNKEEVKVVHQDKLEKLQHRSIIGKEFYIRLIQKKILPLSNLFYVVYLNCVSTPIVTVVLGARISAHDLTCSVIPHVSDDRCLHMRGTRVRVREHFFFLIIYFIFYTVALVFVSLLTLSQ